MTKLDAVTLDFVIDVIELVSMLLMIVVWQVNRRLPGTAFWALAAALYAPGGLLSDIATSSGVNTNLDLTIFNVLTFVANLCLLEGILRFRAIADDTLRLRKYYGLFFFIVYLSLSYFYVDMPLQRRLFICPISITVLFSSVLALLWRARGPEIVVNSVISLFFLVMIAAETGRWWITLHLGNISLADQHPWMNLYLLSSIMFVMGWTYGLSIACSFRVQTIMLTMAREDALTQLPNRRYVDEIINLAIKQSRRSGVGFGVILIDLNKFKMVNDELGHSVGDGLLVEVAKRLRSFRRDTDFIGRIGGDEFIAITRNVEKAQVMLRIMQRLRSTLDGVATVRGQHLFISSSMGAAFWPDDGELEQNLLHTADQRMYQDKAEQKSCWPDVNRA